MKHSFLTKLTSLTVACTMLCALCAFPAVLAASKPAAAELPEGHSLILQDDFEGYADKITTGKSGWSKMASSATSTVSIFDDSGNKVCRFANTAEKTGYPRLEKVCPAPLSSLTVQYSVDVSNSKSYVELFADEKVNTVLASLTSNEADMKRGYNSVKIELDFKKMSYDVFLNGKKLSKNNPIKEIADPSSFSIRFNNAINSGDAILLDNVCISTPDDINANRIIADDGSVNFSLLKGNEAAPFTPNLKQHPRLFINDFGALKEKINTDYMCRTWYTNTKSTAEKYMGMAVYEYSQNSRDNILEISRGIMDRVYTLAFMYNIDGDKRYLDKAYENLEAACRFPDWTPGSFLCTAEMMNAFAVGYDWLYYNLTDEQRATLTNAMMRLGVTPLVYNYEGDATGTNFTTSSINWNPVCNGSSMIAALGMVADTYPNAAEYMLEKAAKALPYAMPPYAPNGAYPEGTGYWLYGTKYLVYAMAVLESSVNDGFTLPENYIFYNYPGISETADFPVYYNGPVGAFNFGDSGDGITSSSIFYWFAEKFNKPQYAWRQKSTEQETKNTLNGMEGALASIWYNPDNAVPAPGVFSLDKAYTNEKGHNGIALRSSFEDKDALYVAMQGGENKANHQYLSIGTIMLEADGKRFITMRGYGSYDYPNYFSNGTNDSARWTYYVARAEAQNTIIANPTLSADQEVSAVGKTIAFESSDSEAFGVLDMTQTNKAFTDAKRGIYLADNRSKVILQDEIKADKPSEFWWFVHTGADVEIAPDGRSAMLTIGEKRLWVNMVSAPDDAAFVLMDSKPLPTSPNPTMQSLNFGEKLAIHIQNCKDLKLSVEFVPLKVGEAPSEEKTQFTPISKWKARDAAPTLSSEVSEITALMLNSPCAWTCGAKTYVDTENTDVMPIEIDGRTLVPVRFISENFGASVGWDESTRTVSVDYAGRKIQLKIDSNVMLVDGEKQMIDVPAQQINDRTLIPLRAMSEAIDKTVFWDERGLIIIKDGAVKYSSDTITALVNLLGTRVKAGGEDISFFDPQSSSFNLMVDTNAQSAPTITFENAAGESAQITQEAGTLSPATMTAFGKTYTFNFIKDIYSGASDNSEFPQKLRIGLKDEGALPSENPWIEVKHMEISGGENYGTAGLTDNSLDTSWRAEGEQWVSFDLGQPISLYAMGLATMSGDKRKAKFDIAVSDDNENWKTVVAGGLTSGDTLNPDITKLNGITARYVKIIGHGNTSNAWNSYTEVRFYRDEAQLNADMAAWSRYFNSGILEFKKGTSAVLRLFGVRSSGDETALPDDTELTYQSRDESVAKVDANGKVTAVGTGETQLIIYILYKGILKTEYLTVKVK